MFYRILKYGYICYYEPAAYVWHKHRTSMKALRLQLYNYNKGQTSYQLRTLISDHDRQDSLGEIYIPPLKCKNLSLPHAGVQGKEDEKLVY